MRETRGKERGKGQRRLDPLLDSFSVARNLSVLRYCLLSPFYLLTAGALFFFVRRVDYDEIDTTAREVMIDLAQQYGACAFRSSLRTGIPVEGQ